MFHGLLQCEGQQNSSRLPCVLEDGLSSFFQDFVGPLHLAHKDHAPSYGSNDGWSLSSDLTLEIYSLLLCALPILIQI
jgi:hypothetical protein